MPEHPAQEITRLLDVPAFTLDCVAADGACILPAAETFRVLTALEPLTLRWLEGEMELKPGRHGAAACRLPGGGAGRPWPGAGLRRWEKRMSKFYNALIRLVRFALPDMETVWEEPFRRRSGGLLPQPRRLLRPYRHVRVFSLCGISCHPWLNAGIMERKEIPAYVRQDYWWEPGCFFEPLLNMTLPYLMALLLPPILGSVPGVPVYHDNRVIRTFRKSLEYVAQGASSGDLFRAARRPRQQRNGAEPGLPAGGPPDL